MVKRILFGGAEIGSTAANVGLVMLRVFSGLAMAFGHGLGKIPPSEFMVGAVTKLGFPLPGLFAWAAALGEFGGGLLIAAGAFTRPGAFLMGFTMLVAGFMQHAADPFKKKELAFLYLAVSIALLLVGSGRYAVDAWIRRRVGLVDRDRTIE
jgi:putative oxidoreductase